MDIYGVGKHLEMRKRDQEKRESCLESDITLIEIPYWWDNQLESLVATINQRRSDLLLEIPLSKKQGQPIPERPIEGCAQGMLFNKDC